VPFTVAANENWQLTINCTKMPGGSNGYTDVYIYKVTGTAEATTHAFQAIFTQF